MHWTKLFDSEDAAKAKIPMSKAIAVSVAGIEICLAHTSGGLFAVNNACPHLGESLSRGTTNYLNEIVCPWHSYRFHLGSGQECRGRTKPLKSYALENREDGLYIGID